MGIRERAAFIARIETNRQMALTTAVTLEVRDDAAASRTKPPLPPYRPWPRAREI